MAATLQLHGYKRTVATKTQTTTGKTHLDNTELIPVGSG